MTPGASVLLATALRCPMVRKMPGSWGRSLCANVVTTHRGQGSIIRNWTPAPHTEDMPKPCILDKAPLVFPWRGHNVGAKSPRLKAALRICFPQSIHGRGRQEMQHAIVEES